MLPCDGGAELVWNGEVVSGEKVGERGVDVDDVVDVVDNEEYTDVKSVKQPHMNKVDKEENENRNH